MKYHEFRAMSTSIILAAEGEDAAVETGFAQAQSFIEESEKRFTRFSESSELSQLNRSAGEWFNASPDMMAVISEALWLHNQTRGLFDPGILNALEQAGYDRTIDEVQLHGARAVTGPKSIGPVDFGDILLDPEENRIWMPAGLRIDLGGIAKGWIAERAAEILSGWSSACAVNAGGDGFMVGLPAGEQSWHVALEDPNETGREMALLELQPGAVATSTVTKRRWEQAGKTQHHLIDPRTQKPAETDWLSVTAVAAHTTEAEVFAKCLLLGGSREADHITVMAQGFDQHYDGPGVEFIAIDANNQLWGSKHSRELLHV
jgi:thiamine biosynthesis lipoprotein